MWTVLFPLTLGFRWLFLVADVPLAPVLQSGLMMALEIGLVSYLIMPFLAKALRSWLYPAPDAISLLTASSGDVEMHTPHQTSSEL